jgi:hypothetical protein
MAKHAKKEKAFYPQVEKWVKRHFLCFATGVDVGTRFGRIDVVGLRDVGGDLSGEIEAIAIEVKRPEASFAASCGQARAYSVYAHRVYLAYSQDEPFSWEEEQVANCLGVGLVQIKGSNSKEVLSSALHRPLPRLHSLMLEKLKFGKCRLCDSYIKIGDKKLFDRVARENIKSALDKRKGIMFWNREVADRKKKMKIRELKGDTETYERRFLCSDCVSLLFGEE